MKKLVFVAAAVLLVAAGCNSSQQVNTGGTNSQTGSETAPTSNSQTQASNNQPSDSGSTSGQSSASSGLVFSSKATSGPAADLYKGEVTLSGNFEVVPQNQPFAGELIFNVDTNSQSKLPQKWGEYPSRITFDNQSQAKQMLNQSLTCPKGTATIVIKDYTSVLLEGETIDNTTLAQVLNSSCK